MASADPALTCAEDSAIIAPANPSARVGRREFRQGGDLNPHRQAPGVSAHSHVSHLSGTLAAV